MDEDAVVPTIAIELIWLPADWPQGSPVSGALDPTYALPAEAGRAGLDPVLVSVRLAAAPDVLLDEFLDTVLTPAGRAALTDQGIGVAVFGRRMRPGQRLREGDRIELLASITADPKSDRRDRVRRERAAGDRDKWRTR